MSSPTDVEAIFKEAETSMKKAVDYFKNEIAGFRTGRASSKLVEDIKVDYYGSKMPLKQIASITIPEHNQIVIQPWDQNAVSEIEKAIREYLNLNPTVQGNIIRVVLPPLTEERRKELVRLLHKLAEEARVAIRNVRREAKDKIEDLEGVGEDEIRRLLDRLQKLTDKYIEAVNQLCEAKEKEILSL
ncbi:MAG: ribosome recycling factor [Gammaproteobacteria bacterium]|nr:MAG: ribosome recycling factor [Gammaproteobacteria bacterium]